MKSTEKSRVILVVSFGTSFDRARKMQSAVLREK